MFGKKYSLYNKHGNGCSWGMHYENILYKPTLIYRVNGKRHKPSYVTAPILQAREQLKIKPLKRNKTEHYK